MNDDAMDYYFSGEELMDETGPEPVPAPVRKSGGSKPQQSQGGESRVGSVLAIIFVSVLAAALLGAVIYALDKRNTLYNKVSSLNNELHLAEAENVRLQSELESQMSAKNVEDYAENVLGMRKIDSSQIEYIKIRTGDVVTIPDKKESLLTKVKNFFDECVEYFRG
jgi:cell division protein FtsL